MAKIIDPFDDENGPDRQEEEKPEQLDWGQVREFAESLMDAFEIGPEELLSQVMPAELAFLRSEPKTLTAEEVSDLLHRTFGEEAHYKEVIGDEQGSCIHSVEVEGLDFMIVNYNPEKADNLPERIAEHPLMDDFGSDASWIAIEVDFPEIDDEELIDLEDDEDEAPIPSPEMPSGEEEQEGSLAEPLPAEAEELSDDDFPSEEDENPFDAAERIVAVITSELLDDQCESVYVSTTGEQLPYEPDMKEQLRQPFPIASLLGEEEEGFEDFYADDEDDDDDDE